MKSVTVVEEGSREFKEEVTVSVLSIDRRTQNFL